MLYILDYPLNDTLYFGRIRTISLESFKDNPFFTAHTEFFGINAKFDYNLDLPKQPNYFIVDLEESKNLIKYIGDNPFEDEEIKLLKYIDNILNNKNIKSNFLSEIIISLKKNLKNLKEKALNILSNIPDSFYNINNDIIQINRLIQKIFYEFRLKLLSFFYKYYQYDINTLSIIKNKNINELTDFSKEEKILIKNYKDTMHFMSYFRDFIQNFNIFDEIKTSFLFFDEFENLIAKEIKVEQIFNNINYFEIIDNLYSLNQESIIIINFNQLKQGYNLIKNKIIYQKHDKNSKNQLISLNKEIQNHILINKSILFKSFKQIEEIKINQIQTKSIPSLIESYCIKNLDNNYLITCSLIYCFSIVFPLYQFKNNKDFLLVILQEIEKMKFFHRYYLYILFKSIDKYYSINNEINKFSDLNKDNIFIYYNIIINSFTKNHIFPNKEINDFIKRFSKQNKNENFNIEKDALLPPNDKIDNKIITKNGFILNLNYKGKELKARLLEPIDIYNLFKKIYNNYDFNILNLESEDIIELIINIMKYIINDENGNNNIIKFLSELVLIIVDKIKIDVVEYNKKILEKDNFKFPKLFKYLSF